MQIVWNNSAAAWHALWLGALVVGVLWLGRRLRAQRLGRLIPTPRLQREMTATVSHRARLARALLLLAGAALLGLAWLRPQVFPGEKIELPATGRDVMVVLDVSRSMLATDVTPTRLGQAREFMDGLMRALPGDRFGLVLFDGVGYQQCPLTFSRSSFRLILEDVHAGMLPAGGSDLGAGMATALDAFDGAEGAHQSVVVISDGEELQGDLDAVLSRLRDSRIPVHAVGVGDPDVGSLIQLPAADGEFVTWQGERVRTRLNEAALKRLAAAGRGEYVHSTDAAPGVDAVAAALRRQTPEGSAGGVLVRPHEVFQWLLLPGVICLLARLALSERRRRPALALPLLLATASLAAGAAEPAPDPLAAELRARLEGDLPAHEAARLNYNLGRRLQELDRDVAAVEAYDRALAAGGTREVRGRCCQNLAVILQRRGRATITSAPQAAVADLRLALKHYDEALRLRPDDDDLQQSFALAKDDLARARRRLQQEQAYEEKLEQARAAAVRALDRQRTTADADDTADTDAGWDEARTRTRRGLALVQELVPLARAVQRADKPVAAADRLQQAVALQTRRLDAATAEVEKAAVVEHLAEAVRLLGGDPGNDDDDHQDNGEQPPKNGADKEHEDDSLAVLRQFDTRERELRRGETAEQQPKQQQGGARRDW